MLDYATTFPRDKIIDRWWSGLMRSSLNFGLILLNIGRKGRVG